METTEYSLHDLTTKAEHYAAAAEHCAYDVRLKLRQWGCTSADEQTIIAHLQRNGYIDHRRYARAYTHDQVAYHGWGRNKIKAALCQKFIDEQAINDALQDIDTQAYTHALQRAIAQKKGATREQLLRFLLQRGFTYDEIHRFVSPS